jgi:hypothetical protein
VAIPSAGGYSPTVPFDRTLRIPLQTPRMTLKQTGVVATIALVTASLGAAGLSTGTDTTPAPEPDPTAPRTDQ